MRKSVGSLFLLAAVASSTQPAAAQGTDVLRRSFAFFDRNLTVEVVGQGSGVLHVVRGGRDRLDVSARTDEGTPGVAMAGWKQDRLRLSGAGAGLEYVVVIPEDVRLEVVLPESARPLPATGGPSATYRWPVSDGPTGAYVPQAGGPALIAYDYPTTPGVLEIEDLAGIERIAVRISGAEFRIASSSLISLARRADGLALLGSGGPHLLVELPAGTREFLLVAAGRPAIRLSGGTVHVLCSPATRQVLADGSQWIDLSPGGRQLQCDRAG